MCTLHLNLPIQTVSFNLISLITISIVVQVLSLLLIYY